jgi:hypothetical protein
VFGVQSSVGQRAGRTRRYYFVVECDDETLAAAGAAAFVADSTRTDEELIDLLDIRFSAVRMAGLRASPSGKFSRPDLSRLAESALTATQSGVLSSMPGTYAIAATARICLC